MWPLNAQDPKQIFAALVLTAGLEFKRFSETIKYSPNTSDCTISAYILKLDNCSNFAESGSKVQREKQKQKRQQTADLRYAC